MRIPAVRGVIDRRILVNYRVDPAVLAPLVPAPFRPKLHRGFGMVGICLIRLKEIRPVFLPRWLGFGSENAAHRTAVELDENGTVREGVYIRRRDTSSRFNALTGGRFFPGIHHHARFTVTETGDDFRVELASEDGETRMMVQARRTEHLPETSIFDSIDEASNFYRRGSLGYSATPEPTRFQGLELSCRAWNVQPLEVHAVYSSFFDNETLFPKGSITFDCALLMRNIEHEWHGKQDLCGPQITPIDANLMNLRQSV